MNLPHLHLLLNHWPIIGAFIAFTLFIVGLLTRNSEIKLTSYVLFALIALLTIPVYLSGNAAEVTLKKAEPDTWNAAMAQTHEGAALLAFIGLELTGLFAFCGLWPTSRSAKPETQEKGWVSFAVLISGAITAGLMAIAGNTGGNIRHPEIPVEGGATASIATMGAALLADIRYFVIDYSRWIWPVIEDLHFIGLIMLLGAVGILSLRILGFLKSVPVGPLQRLIPMGIIGLAINVVTGFMFFIGMPYFYTGNWYFQVKILLVVIASFGMVLFYGTGMFRKWGRVDSGDDAPALAKLVAVVSIVLWIVIVVIGRYIPLGEST